MTSLNSIKQPKDLIVWVNPQLITTQFRRSESWRRRLEKMHFLQKKWILKANDFQARNSIDDIKKFSNLKDLVSKIDNHRSSIWYCEMLESLKSKKVIKHKQFVLKSTSDLDTLFETYLIPLVHSAKNGFDSLKSNEYGHLVIDADGTLLKGSHANHRFYLSKIFKTTSFPLLLSNIHEDWAQQHFTSKTTYDEMCAIAKNHCSKWHPSFMLDQT